MKKSALTALGFSLVLLVVSLAGCSHAGKTRSSTQKSPAANNHETTDAFAAQRDRESYVDGNYERLMKTGRFKNDAEAKAYAAYEWQRDRRTGSTQNETVTWSSTDAAKRAQKQFESDLEKMSR